MRRVLQVADLHLGLLRYGQTAADQERFLNAIVATRDEVDADVVVIAGDVFHTRRPAAPEILSFIRLLKRLTQNAQVLITAGNHDGPGEVEEVLQKPTGWMAEIGMPGVWAAPGAGVHLIRDVLFYVLPYIHRRSRFAEHLEPVIAAWPKENPTSRGIPAVFVGHLSVAGSRLSAESVMQIGWDVTVPSSVFTDYTAAMLGHIHHQQNFNDHVWYCGSPERFDFGEEDQTKGGLVWTFDGDRLVTVEHVDFGARSMLTREITAEDSAWINDIVPGSVVRLIVTAPVRAWSSLSADLHAEATKAGASWVRVERRSPERSLRVRAEMDPNTDVLTSLRQWCTVVGEDFEVIGPTAADLVR
jgi:DNA repair exonuclease SbcCD nuclease subunit